MHNTHFIRLTCFLVVLLAFVQLANAQTTPPVLAKPGETVPLPPPGTPTPYRAADYDRDVRNEWSKAEFPVDGTCRWMPPEPPNPYRGPGPANQTKAEYDAQMARIERTRAFVATAPVLSPPMGVCPRIVSMAADNARDFGGFAMKSSFMLQLWPAWNVERRVKNGPISYGELTHLIFELNNMPDWEVPYKGSDAEGSFFSEPKPTAYFQGFPTFNELLVIAHNDRPLWRPVSLARILRWQMTQLDEELKTIRAMMSDAQQQYDKNTSPEGRAEQERIIQLRIERQYAKTPEAQERVRKNAKAEWSAQEEEWLDKAKARKPDHPLNKVMPRKQALEQRIAALTPTEAAKQGCLVPRDKSYETPEVVTASDKTCVQPMVERNPDFYDRRLPRTAIQLLALYRFPPQRPQGGTPPQRYMNQWANAHAVYGIDWQKFRQEVMGK